MSAPIFLNVRPQQKALDIIDEVRHPGCAKYARQNIERGAKGISEGRERGWIRGYQRFGDEFEAALKNVNTALNPRVFHRRLETNLDDPWKLMGVTFDELGDDTRAAWGLVKRRSSVVAAYAARGDAPVGLGRVLEWRLAGTVSHFSALRSGSWTQGLAGVADSFVKGLWTVDDLLMLVDDGLTFDEFENHVRAGMRKPHQFEAFLRRGVPLEYAMLS